MSSVTETAVPSEGYQSATVAGAAPPKRPYTKIDWKRGAKLLAAGLDAEDVAAALGIDEDRLWRHLHRSLRFRFLVRQAAERRRQLCELQVDIAAPAMVRHCALDRGAAPDPAMLREVTGYAAARAAARQEKTAPDPLQALADSGQRPPNQAKRRRLMARQEEHDVEAAGIIAVARTALEQYRAGQAQADAAAAAPVPAAPSPLQAARGRLARVIAARAAQLAGSDGKPAEAEIVANEPERTETVTNEPEQTAVPPAIARQAITTQAELDAAVAAARRSPPVYNPDTDPHGGDYGTVRPSRHGSIVELPGI